MRFCPGCGASVISGAQFCVECGVKLADFAGAPSNVDEPSSAAPLRAANPPPPPPATSNRAFFAIFAAILVVGAAVAYLIMRQLPQREHLLASAPPAATSTATQGNQLPPGHPKIEVPKEARDFIAQTEQKAQANPSDMATWNRLGDVCLRAAMFDSSYYAKASEAYAHVLKLDPNNLDALRGIGNIDFDQRKFDEAIAAYEHYLGEKPDDPNVRTDLGTMLLSSGVADQAVVQYKKVLEKHPEFFEANFNLGVAYGELNDAANARAEFDKALKLAPDDTSRNRVNQMLAALDGAQGTAPASAAQPKSSTVLTGGASAANPGTFKGALEQMLRDLPIAGPKVESVQWQADNRARVLMNNFPMDQMPPFAASKFIADLKAGIEQVKTSHKVSAPVEVDIADAASGRVMKSITE